MKKTYTVTELARAVGVSPSTVRRMLQDQRIPEPERDWRDYRVFNKRDLNNLKKIVSTNTPRPEFRPAQHANARTQ